jgi:hypothetical protein
MNDMSSHRVSPRVWLASGQSAWIKWNDKCGRFKADYPWKMFHENPVWKQFGGTGHMSWKYFGMTVELVLFRWSDLHKTLKKRTSIRVEENSQWAKIETGIQPGQLMNIIAAHSDAGISSQYISTVMSSSSPQNTIDAMWFGDEHLPAVTEEQSAELLEAVENNWVSGGTVFIDSISEGSGEQELTQAEAEAEGDALIDALDALDYPELKQC